MHFGKSDVSIRRPTLANEHLTKVHSPEIELLLPLADTLPAENEHQPALHQVFRHLYAASD